MHVTGRRLQRFDQPPWAAKASCLSVFSGSHMRRCRERRCRRARPIVRFAVRVHVVADDTVTHLCGTYRQWKPYVALTSDN